MSPSAQQIQFDFIRFAGVEGSSLYWDQFLRNGTSEWPSRLRDQFPALSAWQGTTHLKDRLKQLVCATSESQLFLANRSAQLMQLASKLLFHHCNNILLTDLTWPSYANILQSHQLSSGCTLTRVDIRKSILRDRIGPEELIDWLVHQYVGNGCDGIFFPAIDNLGVRLPIPEIVRAIRRHAPIRFVAIDAAQALGHIPLAETLNVSDFLIAGCHKWMCASLPMGVGFFKARQAPYQVDNTCHEMVAKGLLDDPLLCFSSELEGKPASRFGETVNVAPLFSCLGAVNDALHSASSLCFENSIQLENADLLRNLLDDRKWHPVMPHKSFGSGIVLIRHKLSHSLFTSASELRRWFHDHGISVTAYNDGLIRLSMPKRPWTADQLESLRNTFVIGNAIYPKRRKLASHGGLGSVLRQSVDHNTQRTDLFSTSDYRFTTARFVDP